MSFVEVDGHYVMLDGRAAAAPATNPTSDGDEPSPTPQPGPAPCVPGEVGCPVRVHPAGPPVDITPSGVAHGTLTFCGFFLPPCDWADAALYGAEGNPGEAGLALAGTVPFVDLLKIGKGFRFTDEAAELGGDLGSAARVGVRAEEGYRSYASLTTAIGRAGDGRVWHHIVEQSMQSRGRFDPQLIQNPRNVVNISREANQQIANYYSTIPQSGFTANRTVRDWLEGQSYDEQYEFGIDILDRVLAGEPLP